MFTFNHGPQNVSFQVYSDLAALLLPITLEKLKGWGQISFSFSSQALLRGMCFSLALHFIQGNAISA